MAFNLKLVLKALLFSSSQPLSTKDVQTVFARFHEQSVRGLEAEVEKEEPGPAAAETPVEAPETLPAIELKNEAPSGAPAANPDEVETGPASTPLAEKDADLYADVPSLITATQIREAMTAIADELRQGNHIYLLIEGPTGYRLVTHPRFARWIRTLRNEPAPVKLNQSALETLAIIAYRQPVTRTEIESIRGVSADAGLNKLLERELVYITGRADLPGRPLQYGTTDRFMDFVGVKSLVELPASDVLSPRQIDEWLKNAVNVKTPTDAEMGLPLEEGEGATPNLENVQVEQSHETVTAEIAPLSDETPAPAASENADHDAANSA